ncbi:hypothetical protein CCACVL1_06083 [Corchorus capsularis]|uniref:Uncharacterized protein n=1 Tax=Corchorus capsularis TaxID=210143 RepID=A0A1R3JHE7_COCAP|nr:hypothetical protein CCACVL1_06083 [Corchorus capsularis]
MTEGGEAREEIEILRKKEAEFENLMEMEKTENLTAQESENNELQRKLQALRSEKEEFQQQLDSLLSKFKTVQPQSLTLDSAQTRGADVPNSSKKREFETQIREGHLDASPVGDLGVKKLKTVDQQGSRKKPRTSFGRKAALKYAPSSSVSEQPVWGWWFPPDGLLSAGSLGLDSAESSSDHSNV